MRRFIHATLVLGIALAFAVPAGAAPRIVRCVDGNPDSAWVQGIGQPSDISCDADGVRDGVCTFLGACPLCYFETPNCLAPCVDPPDYEWGTLGVGRSVSLRLGNETVLLRCDRQPSPRQGRPARPPRPSRPQQVR